MLTIWEIARNLRYFEKFYKFEDMFLVCGCGNYGGLEVSDFSKIWEFLANFGNEDIL